jgi:hypothetical protein
VRARQINNNPRAKCSLFAYLCIRTYLDAELLETTSTLVRWWELLAFNFWPSYFRATAAISFLMFEDDAMRCTAVIVTSLVGGPTRTLSVTRQGARFSKKAHFCAFPRPKVIGPFLILCTAVECEFSKLYFLPHLVSISPSSFVQILSLARPCISSREQQLGNLADAWGQN